MLLELLIGVVDAELRHKCRTPLTMQTRLVHTCSNEFTSKNSKPAISNTPMYAAESGRRAETAHHKPDHATFERQRAVDTLNNPIKHRRVNRLRQGITCVLGLSHPISQSGRPHRIPPVPQQAAEQSGSSPFSHALSSDAPQFAPEEPLLHTLAAPTPPRALRLVLITGKAELNRADLDPPGLCRYHPHALSQQ